MSKFVWVALGFLGGAAVGIFAGKKLAEDAAEAKARDEIEAVKQAFHKEVDAAAERKAQYEKEGKKPEKKTEEKPEPTMKEMKPGSGITEQQVQDYRKAAAEYDKATVTQQEKEIREMAASLKPRIIDDDEVGMKEEYGVPLQLTYYADDILVDEQGEVVEPQEFMDMIGTEWVEFMKTHDSCAIVNDRRRCYYEITADANTWEEVQEQKPYLKFQ